MRPSDPLQLPFSTLHLTRPGFTSIGRSWQLDIALDDARPLRFFGLVALYDGPNENASINDELALRITDTIRYHKQLLEGSRVSVTVEDFFEQCLQKINGELNMFLRNYAKPLPVHSWAMLIGMLSLDDNPKRLQLSVSRFGEIGGWLLHSAQLDTKKLISIFDSPDSLQPQVAPHKFFRNVLSSSLSKNDQLFFCTPNILNYISLSDLKKILSMLSVNAAMKQLENQMNFSGNDSVVCAMTMRLSPYPMLEQADQRIVPAGSAQQSIETLTSLESETQKLLSTTFGLNVKRFFTFLLNRVSAGIKQVMPGVSRSMHKGWQSLKTARESSQPKRASIKKAAPTLRNMDLLTMNHTVTKVPVWKERLHWFAVPLKKAGIRLRQALGSFISSGLWKQPKFYVTFLVLLVSVSGFAYWRISVSRFNSMIAAAEAELQEVQNNVNRIDAFLIYGNENDAASLLQESRTRLASTQDLEEIREQRQSLEASLADQQRRLRKEIIVEPSTLLNNLADQLTSQPRAMLRYDGDYFVFGQNPRSYLVFDPETGTTTVKTIQTDMSVLSSVALLNQEAILVGDNKVVRLNLATGEATSSIANTTASLKGAAVYNERLYTLSPSEQQILRSNRAPSFAVLANWLNEPVDLLEARSLLVDGSIYVLMPNTVYTFNQGLLARVGGLQLDAIDPALQDAKAFAIPEASSLVYILEANRLVVYERDGDLKAQYPAKDGQTFINLMIDETEKKAYILTNNQLLTIGLEI